MEGSGEKVVCFFSEGMVAPMTGARSVVVVRKVRCWILKPR